MSAPSVWHDAITVAASPALIIALTLVAIAAMLLWDSHRPARLDHQVRIDDELARRDREARQFAAMKTPRLTQPAVKGFSKQPIPFNPNTTARAVSAPRERV